MSGAAVAAEKTRRGLTQNHLKLIALVSMTVDHIGVTLFPHALFLRIIGRLAYPIFAFSLYEGAKYTRHPWRYLLRMAGLGFVCMAAYYVYDRRLVGNILIAFSLSLCMLLSLRYCRREQRAGHTRQTVFWLFLTACSLLVTGVTCRIIRVDYGLYGCVLPLYAALSDPDFAAPAACQPVDRCRRFYPLLGFSVGLLLLSVRLGGVQYYSLLALPLLLLKGDRRGTPRLKYFFYFYYPLHLAVLEGLSHLF